MIVCPIGSYYLSLEYVWGRTSLSAALSLSGALLSRQTTIIDPSFLSLPSRAIPFLVTYTVKNTTGAALTAAITANLVLVGFVWVAMAEDRADAKREKEKKKQ